MIENLTVAHISLGGFPAFTCSGTFSQSLGESASNQTGLVFPKTLLTVPRYPLIYKRYWQLREIRLHGMGTIRILIMIKLLTGGCCMEKDAFEIFPFEHQLQPLTAKPK